MAIAQLVLPRELICEILLFSDAWTLQTSRLVCKQWEKCIQEHSIILALLQLGTKKICLKPQAGMDPIQWFNTITDALKAAEPGREIWLGPGDYPESLQLNSDITLRNMGKVDDVKIDVPATSFLDIRSGAPVLRNLKLGSDNGREFSCILVSGGSPKFLECDMQMLYLLGGENIEVSDCVVQHLSIQNEGRSYIRNNLFPGSRFASVCVTGKQTFPVIEDNLIRSGELMGVLLEECWGAQLNGNTIHDVRQCGIEAFETKQLIVGNNIIRNCGSYGVYVRSRSYAYVTRNSFTGCGSAAICFDHSRASICENTVKDVGSSAIHCYYCPKGTITGNRVEGTGHSSVILDGCHGVNFTENFITSTEPLALLVIKGTDVVVDQNHISSNGSNMVIENASPMVSRNTITKGSIGVLVYGNSMPVLEDNDITDHDDAGIDILVGSSPVLQKNRIIKNAGSGVAISEVINFVERCDFQERTREALVKNGLPLLLNNRIHENTLMAVNSKGFMLAEYGNSYENNQNYVPEEIIACVKRDQCTFTETGSNYVPQYWHPSVGDRNIGICSNCFNKGHFEVMGEVREFLPTPVLSRFYCDCTCENPKGEEEEDQAEAEDGQCRSCAGGNQGSYGSNGPEAAEASSSGYLDISDNQTLVLDTYMPPPYDTQPDAQPNPNPLPNQPAPSFDPDMNLPQYPTFSSIAPPEGPNGYEDASTNTEYPPILIMTPPGSPLPAHVVPETPQSQIFQLCLVSPSTNGISSVNSTPHSTGSWTGSLPSSPELVGVPVTPPAGFTGSDLYYTPPSHQGSGGYSLLGSQYSGPPNAYNGNNEGSAETEEDSVNTVLFFEEEEDEGGF